MSEFSPFKLLTFDCYGTLIDWETGITDALVAWKNRTGIDISDDALLELYGNIESRMESEYPEDSYRVILERVFGCIGSEFDATPTEEEIRAFATSVPDWPEFHDSPDALARLKKKFRLQIVSNVDTVSFAGSARRLRVEFDAVVTAEEVGAYKPDPRVFERALEVASDLGIAKHEILHVAQSLYHDHVPAKDFDLSTVWINRRTGRKGWGATPRPNSAVQPDFEYSSMADFANAAIS